MRFGVLNEGELVYIGYPNDSATGTVSVDFSEIFAVNRATALADGAWEFIDFVMNFSELILSEARHSRIPSSKAVFRDWIVQESETPYVCDLHNFIAMPLRNEMAGDDPVVVIDEKFREAYYEKIASLKACGVVPSEIREIVEEELSAFYAGLHSAEETGKTISSRISLYLKEKN